jgi:hypothetical protein
MVCDGLDQAVQKMKKGEKSLITISPAHGYGAAGYSGRLAQVGPMTSGSNNTHHLKSVSMQPESPLTAKYPLSMSTFDDRCCPQVPPNTTVTYELELVDFVNGKVGEVRGAFTPVYWLQRLPPIAGTQVFRHLIDSPFPAVAVHILCPARELLVDVALFTLVTLLPWSHLSHISVGHTFQESWEMSDPEKVEAAVARKDKGNAAYKEGKVQRAIKLYDKVR